MSRHPICRFLNVASAILLTGCINNAAYPPVRAAPLFRTPTKLEEPAAQELKQKLDRRGLGVVCRPGRDRKQWLPGGSYCESYPEQYRIPLELRDFPSEVVVFNTRGLLASIVSFRNEPVALRIFRLEDDGNIRMVHTRSFPEARYLISTPYQIKAFWIGTQNLLYLPLSRGTVLYDVESRTVTKIEENDPVFANEQGLYMCSCAGCHVQTPNGEKFSLEMPPAYYPWLVTDRHVICLSGIWGTADPLEMIVMDFRTGRTILQGTTQSEAIRIDPQGQRLVAYDPSRKALRIWDLTKDSPSPAEIAFSKEPNWLILGHWSPDSSMLIVGIDWTGAHFQEFFQCFSVALLDLEDLTLYQIGDRTRDSRTTQFFRTGQAQEQIRVVAE